MLQEQNDYYAFGMRQIRDDYPLLASNKYKYNGKELETFNNFETLDYGARMYDLSIGRWNVVDPLAELKGWLTPYNYCSLDPINRIDPDGMSCVSSNGLENSILNFEIGDNNLQQFLQSNPNNDDEWKRELNEITVTASSDSWFKRLFRRLFGSGVASEQKQISSIDNSTSGGGGASPSITSIPPRTDAFDGFLGKVEYVLFGPNIGNARYSINGDYLGPALITGIAPSPGKFFRGGSKVVRDGYLTSLPKEFQRWFHKYWKEASAPNATKSEVDEVFELWKSLGKPRIKK